MTIIVAEDDYFMRTWLLTVLARTGARVHEAASGWEVLGLLADHPEVDLVVSDIRMPAPDGLQALAMARAAGVGVPFLLLTAFGGELMRERAARLGAEVLDKPFAADQLLDRVRALCASLGDAV